MSGCLRCGLSATLKRLEGGYCSDSCRDAADVDDADGGRDEPGAATGPPTGPREPNRESE